MKLRNGVTLSDEFMAVESGARVTRADAAEVFKRGATMIKVRCGCEACVRNNFPAENYWSVTRVGNSIAVGCVRFSSAMVAEVRRWARGNQKGR